MKYRSKREELELILEGLATVQPFAQEVTPSRPLFGWWSTPTVEPVPGCPCELCAGKGEIHLGNVFRLAVHRAAELARVHHEHQTAAAA